MKLDCSAKKLFAFKNSCWFRDMSECMTEIPLEGKMEKRCKTTSHGEQFISPAPLHDVRQPSGWTNKY